MEKGSRSVEEQFADLRAEIERRQEILGSDISSRCTSLLAAVDQERVRTDGLVSSVRDELASLREDHSQSSAAQMKDLSAVVADLRSELSSASATLSSEIESRCQSLHDGVESRCTSLIAAVDQERVRADGLVSSVRDELASLREDHSQSSAAQKKELSDVVADIRLQLSSTSATLSSVIESRCQSLQDGMEISSRSVEGQFANVRAEMERRQEMLESDISSRCASLLAAVDQERVRADGLVSSVRNELASLREDHSQSSAAQKKELFDVAADIRFEMASHSERLTSKIEEERAAVHNLMDDLSTSLSSASDVFATRLQSEKSALEMQISCERERIDLLRKNVQEDLRECVALLEKRVADERDQVTALSESLRAEISASGASYDDVMRREVALVSERIDYIAQASAVKVAAIETDLSVVSAEFACHRQDAAGERAQAAEVVRTLRGDLCSLENRMVELVTIERQCTNDLLAAERNTMSEKLQIELDPVKESMAHLIDEQHQVRRDICARLAEHEAAVSETLSQQISHWSCHLDGLRASIASLQGSVADSINAERVRVEGALAMSEGMVSDRVMKENASIRHELSSMSDALTKLDERLSEKLASHSASVSAHMAAYASQSASDRDLLRETVHTVEISIQNQIATEHAYFENALDEQNRNLTGTCETLGSELRIRIDMVAQKHAELLEQVEDQHVAFCDFSVQQASQLLVQGEVVSNRFAEFEKSVKACIDEQRLWSEAGFANQVKLVSEQLSMQGDDLLKQLMCASTKQSDEFSVRLRSLQDEIYAIIAQHADCRSRDVESWSQALRSLESHLVAHAEREHQWTEAVLEGQDSRLRASIQDCRNALTQCVQDGRDELQIFKDELTGKAETDLTRVLEQIDLLDADLRATLAKSFSSISTEHSDLRHSLQQLQAHVADKVDIAFNKIANVDCDLRDLVHSLEGSTSSRFDREAALLQIHLMELRTQWNTQHAEQTAGVEVMIHQLIDEVNGQHKAVVARVEGIAHVVDVLERSLKENATSHSTSLAAEVCAANDRLHQLRIEMQGDIRNLRHSIEFHETEHVAWLSQVFQPLQDTSLASFAKIDNVTRLESSLNQLRQSFDAFRVEADVKIDTELQMGYERFSHLLAEGMESSRSWTTTLTSSIRDEITSLQSDFASVKADQARINAVIDELNRDFTTFSTAQTEIECRWALLSSQVESLLADAASVRCSAQESASEQLTHVRILVDDLHNSVGQQQGVATANLGQVKESLAAMREEMDVSLKAMRQELMANIDMTVNGLSTNLSQQLLCQLQTEVETRKSECKRIEEVFMAEMLRSTSDFNSTVHFVRTLVQDNSAACSTLGSFLQGEITAVRSEMMSKYDTLQNEAWAIVEDFATTFGARQDEQQQSLLAMQDQWTTSLAETTQQLEAFIVTSRDKAAEDVHQLVSAVSSSVEKELCSFRADFSIIHSDMEKFRSSVDVVQYWASDCQKGNLEIRIADVEHRLSACAVSQLDSTYVTCTQFAQLSCRVEEVFAHTCALSDELESLVASTSQDRCDFLQTMHASRQDLSQRVSDLESRMVASLAQLREDMRSGFDELQTSAFSRVLLLKCSLSTTVHSLECAINQLRQEVCGVISQLEDDVSADISDLRGDMVELAEDVLHREGLARREFILRLSSERRHFDSFRVDVLSRLAFLGMSQYRATTEVRGLVQAVHEDILEQISSEKHDRIVGTSRLYADLDALRLDLMSYIIARASRLHRDMQESSAQIRTEAQHLLEMVNCRASNIESNLTFVMKCFNTRLDEMDSRHTVELHNYAETQDCQYIAMVSRMTVVSVALGAAMTELRDELFTHIAALREHADEQASRCRLETDTLKAVVQEGLNNCHASIYRIQSKTISLNAELCQSVNDLRLDVCTNNARWRSELYKAVQCTDRRILDIHGNMVTQYAKVYARVDDCKVEYCSRIASMNSHLQKLITAMDTKFMAVSADLRKRLCQLQSAVDCHRVDALAGQAAVKAAICKHQLAVQGSLNNYQRVLHDDLLSSEARLLLVIQERHVTLESLVEAIRCDTEAKLCDLSTSVDCVMLGRLFALQSLLRSSLSQHEDMISCLRLDLQRQSDASSTSLTTLRKDLEALSAHHDTSSLSLHSMIQECTLHVADAEARCLGRGMSLHATAMATCALLDESISVIDARFEHKLIESTVVTHTLVEKMRNDLDCQAHQHAIVCASRSDRLHALIDTTRVEVSSSANALTTELVNLQNHLADRQDEAEMQAMTKLTILRSQFNEMVGLVETAAVAGLSNLRAELHAGLAAESDARSVAVDSAYISLWNQLQMQKAVSSMCLTTVSSDWFAMLSEAEARLRKEQQDQGTIFLFTLQKDLSDLDDRFKTTVDDLEFRARREIGHHVKLLNSSLASVIRTCNDFENQLARDRASVDMHLNEQFSTLMQQQQQAQNDVSGEEWRLAVEEISRRINAIEQIVATELDSLNVTMKLLNQQTSSSVIVETACPSSEAEATQGEPQTVVGRNGASSESTVLWFALARGLLDPAPASTTPVATLVPLVESALIRLRTQLSEVDQCNAQLCTLADELSRRIEGIYPVLDQQTEQLKKGAALARSKYTELDEKVERLRTDRDLVRELFDSPTAAARSPLGSNVSNSARGSPVITSPDVLARMGASEALLKARVDEMARLFRDERVRIERELADIKSRIENLS
jgi:hypothetical protein